MSNSICFVGLDNYPVLNPASGVEYFGGESVQQTLLARAFASHGYDVSMVVKDHGQTQGEVLDGIRVWKTFNESEGMPVFRFFYPRMTSMINALGKADADIYYQSCAAVWTGVVAWYSRRNRKKFVFRIAHDSDCIPGKQIIRFSRDRIIYEYGLKRADFIAAQGVNQIALLKENYSLNSVPVNMVVELPDPDMAADPDIDVLWVNNLRDFKRPELLMELAERLPDIQFTMIGGVVPGCDELYQEIERKSAQLENVTFLGAVPYNQVNDYFARAKLFVNTSDWEGFPNSFLQAWARRVPVISFFDPDGLIESRGLGAVPEDLSGMAESIKGYLRMGGKREESAARSYRFVVENYAPDAVVRKYEDIMDNKAAGLKYVQD